MPLRNATARRTLLGAIVVATGMSALVAADWYRTVPKNSLAKASYVGRQSCAQCHQPETAAWTGSDHDLAMDLATDATVLADFNDTTYERLGERTRFFRAGERYMVNAEGPDGKYHDYEVKYVFGVRPLQQYMVEFPDGRVQVLRVSWDVNKKEWFHVAPADAPDERFKPDDPFHWTGLTQNWNTMCAECHVTDYHKNYDLATNSYHSEFKEIDVSCETCHGPGSLHVELAEAKSLFWDREVGYGLTNKLKGATNVHQVETCAPCHSRRAIIHPNYRAGDSYYQHFELTLLENRIYHADGQIEDEDYEFGSFTQSRMYREGVRCSDCHNPHSLKLKFEGNRLCAQCHLPGKYDGAVHHHHANAAPGAPETQCVTCHMPDTVYMGIDARRDHSIRVPRPDLTASIGTPNACNRCHTAPAENAQWAADAVVKWYGPKRPDDPHYAHAIAAGRRRDPAGDALLCDVMQRANSPDIVRATVIELLQGYGSQSSEQARVAALDDRSPLVRAAAVRSVGAQSIEELIDRVAPKLEDAERTVRMAAANRLVADAGAMAKQLGGALAAAVRDYRQGQSVHLDRAQSHRNLANVSMQMGDVEAAVASFRTAIRQEPYLTGPRTELSQLLARIAEDPNRRGPLQRSASPEEIRRLREEEIELLRRDMKLLPEDAGPHFHCGTLLYLLEKVDEARKEIVEACRLAPNEYEYWLWLALICEKQQRWDQAETALARMKQLRPDASDWPQILQNVRAAKAKSTSDSPAAVDPPVTPGQSAAAIAD